VRAQRGVQIKGNKVEHMFVIDSVGLSSRTDCGLEFYSLLHFFCLRARDIQVPMGCIGFGSGEGFTFTVLITLLQRFLIHFFGAKLSLILYVLPVSTGLGEGCTFELWFCLRERWEIYFRSEKLRSTSYVCKFRVLPGL
jgi:hypothetical protein